MILSRWFGCFRCFRCFRWFKRIHFFFILLPLALFSFCLLSGCTSMEPMVCYRDGQVFCTTEDKVPVISWDACYRRGLSCMEGECWQEAVHEFQWAIDLRYKDRRNARAFGMHFRDEYFPHRETGICYLHLDKVDDALTELELSLGQTPSARAKHYLNQARRKYLSITQQDTAAPAIHIKSPQGDKYLTGHTPFQFEGNVVDDQFVAAVSVQDNPLFIELAKPEVPFTSSVDLEEGWNTIRIIAEDLADKRAEKTIRVYLDQQGPLVIINPIKPVNPSKPSDPIDPFNPIEEDPMKDLDDITITALVYDQSGIVSFQMNDEEFFSPGYEDRYDDKDDGKDGGMDGGEDVSKDDGKDSEKDGGENGGKDGGRYDGQYDDQNDGQFDNQFDGQVRIIEKTFPFSPDLKSISFQTRDRAGNITKGQISLLPARREQKQAMRLAALDVENSIPPPVLLPRQGAGKSILFTIFHPPQEKLVTYYQEIFLDGEIEAQDGLQRVTYTLEAEQRVNNKIQKIKLIDWKDLFNAGELANAEVRKAFEEINQQDAWQNIGQGTGRGSGKDGRQEPGEGPGQEPGEGSGQYGGQESGRGPGRGAGQKPKGRGADPKRVREILRKNTLVYLSHVIPLNIPDNFEPLLKEPREETRKGQVKEQTKGQVRGDVKGQIKEQVKEPITNFTLTLQAEDNSGNKEERQFRIKKIPREEIIKGEERMYLAIIPFDFAKTEAEDFDVDYAYDQIMKYFTLQDRFNLVKEKDLPWDFIETERRTGRACNEYVAQQIIERTPAEGVICGDIQKLKDGIQINAYFMEIDSGRDCPCQECCLFHDVFTPANGDMAFRISGLAMKFRDSFPICTGTIEEKKGQTIQVNIGSEKGLFPGMRYNIFKCNRQRELLNKAAIRQVEKNSSEARVLEKEQHGEIENHDCVRTR